MTTETTKTGSKTKAPTKTGSKTKAPTKTGKPPKQAPARAMKGDPELVSFGPGLVGSHTVVNIGTFDSGFWYLVEDEGALEQLRNTRKYFESMRAPGEAASTFDARNPPKFLVMPQSQAIALELDGKPDGTKPSKGLGSPSNPRKPTPFRAVG